MQPEHKAKKSPNQELDFCSWSSISDNNGLLDETFHIFFRLRPLRSVILLKKESVCLSKCSFRLLFTVIWSFFGIDIWYWFLSIILLLHVLYEIVIRFILSRLEKPRFDQIHYIQIPMTTIHGNQIHFLDYFLCSFFTPKYIMGIG